MPQPTSRGDAREASVAMARAGESSASNYCYTPHVVCRRISTHVHMRQGSYGQINKVQQEGRPCFCLPFTSPPLPPACALTLTPLVHQRNLDYQQLAIKVCIDRILFVTKSTSMMNPASALAQRKRLSHAADPLGR